MIFRLVLCGLFQPQMASWERAALLWEGECVLLTEAFITLAAGTSGGGELLLCGVGLVRLHLGGGRLEVWLSSLKLRVPFSPLLVSTCRVCATGTQEIPTETVHRLVPFYRFSQ